MFGRLGYFYYDSLYLTFMVISLVIMLAAQVGIKSSYSKYSKISNRKGITGKEAAEAVLRAAGVTDVQVVYIKGNLTDHYNPKTHVIALSDGVYNESTIAAVGIAAHEAGHAVQHAQHYSPLKLRNAIIPLSNFGPSIGIILLVIGFALNFSGLVYIGIALFSFAFLFQLITLPVEFNASRRAMQAISSSGLLEPDEQRGARKVLTSAAMTYVAAMIQSFLTLLFYFIRANKRRR